MRIKNKTDGKFYDIIEASDNNGGQGCGLPWGGKVKAIGELKFADETQGGEPGDCYFEVECTEDSPEPGRTYVVNCERTETEGLLQTYGYYC